MDWGELENSYLYFACGIEVDINYIFHPFRGGRLEMSMFSIYEILSPNFLRDRKTLIRCQKMQFGISMFFFQNHLPPILYR